MDKLQYLNFMKKYASKDYLKNCILKPKHNADGTFSSKSFRTVNLLKYRQEKKGD